MLVFLGLFDVSGWLWAGSRGHNCSGDGCALCPGTVELGTASFPSLLEKLILMWTSKSPQLVKAKIHFESGRLMMTENMDHREDTPSPQLLSLPQVEEFR